MITHLKWLNDNIWFLLQRGWEKPEGDYDK
jgi:hypothetical protein